MSILPKLQLLSPGTVIPKPEANGEFIVKGWGERSREKALIYFIPNRKHPGKPYQKGVTAGEWDQAYQQLVATGEFTRKWFDANMLRCSREGGCNFTTIGGILSLFGLAEYEARGTYRKL